MTRCTRACLSFVAVAVAYLSFGMPTSALAVSCGDTITSSFTLTANLTNCPGNGLNVTASHVTITCNSGVTIDGQSTANTYGIYVHNNSSTLTDFHTTGCIVKEFSRGVRLENVSGGPSSITNTESHHNTNYGFDLTRATGVTVDSNNVHDNGDEGIHVSGQTSGQVCPNPHLGGNIISSNTVTTSAQEGIYLLCSDSNRVESNDVHDNGATGINLDQTSSSNLILNNDLQNDAITIKLSNNNAIVGNHITDSSLVTSPPARLVFNGGSANYVEDNFVDGDGVTPDACYRIQDEPVSLTAATCNQLVQSSCSDPDTSDINATGASLNNRFFKYSPSGTTLCNNTGTSTVDVYNDANSLIGCAGTAQVIPANCAWWAFDTLCDDGTTNNLGAVQQNAAFWDLDGTTITNTKYYRANGGAIRLSHSTPYIVGSTACLSVSASTSVQLLPGTQITGRFHAVTQ